MTAAGIVADLREWMRMDHPRIRTTLRDDAPSGREAESTAAASEPIVTNLATT
jgi:hypothetical protein